MTDGNSLRIPNTLSPGPTPLYHQLEQELRARILGGEFEPGEALPTEEQICAQYGVSRITVRRAVDALIAGGLITRKRGVGTFYTPPETQGVRSISLSGSLDEFLSSAASLSKTLLSMEECAAPDAVRRALRLKPDEQVTRIELMSLLDGAPLGLSELYLPLAVGRKIQPHDIEETLPVIRTIEQRLGTRVVRAEQTLEACAAGPLVGERLGLDPTTPIVRATRIYFDLTGAPIEMIVAHNHPERYRYTIDFVARPRAV